MERIVRPTSTLDLHPVRTFDEVRDLWFERTGERLSRQRVCQIHRDALRKIRLLLEDEENHHIRDKLMEHLE